MTELIDLHRPTSNSTDHRLQGVFDRAEFRDFAKLANGISLLPISSDQHVDAGICEPNQPRECGHAYEYSLLLFRGSSVG